MSYWDLNNKERERHVTPLGSGQGGFGKDAYNYSNNMHLFLVGDYARSSMLFESGFTGFRGFFRVVIGLDGARSSWVLNQDLQDFEDFLALDIGLDGVRSSMLFESGFSGF
jgi:hypothetical protein